MGKKLKNAKNTITYLGIALCAVVFLFCFYFIFWWNNSVLGNRDATCWRASVIYRNPSCIYSSCWEWGAREPRTQYCPGTRSVRYSWISYVCSLHEAKLNPKWSDSGYEYCEMKFTDFEAPITEWGID